MWSLNSESGTVPPVVVSTSSAGRELRVRMAPPVRVETGGLRGQGAAERGPLYLKGNGLPEAMRSRQPGLEVAEVTPHPARVGW